MQITNPCDVKGMTWQEIQEMYPTEAVVTCHDERLTYEKGTALISISASWALMAILIATVIFKRRTSTWVKYAIGVVAVGAAAVATSFFFKYLQVWVPVRYYSLFADEILAGVSLVLTVVVAMLTWYIHQSPSPDEHKQSQKESNTLRDRLQQLQQELREANLKVRSAQLRVKQYEVVAKSNRIELEIDVGGHSPVYYNEWVHFPSANTGQGMITAICMNAESTVLHLMIEEGFAIDYHHHEWEQVLLCLAGAITVYTRSGEMAHTEVIYPGRSIIIPPRVEHALFANAESQVIKVWIPKIAEQTRDVTNGQPAP